MQRSINIIGSLGVGLLLLVAAVLPQTLLAQRFNHGGGGGAPRPAPSQPSRPAPETRSAPVNRQVETRPVTPVNRPAPVENRSVETRPVNTPPDQDFNRPGENRPVAPAYNGSINGGGRNIGNHDYGRAGTAVIDNRGGAPRPNVHVNVNVYHSHGVPAYRPYAYHPYHPYRWGPRWHPIGFFAASLAADALLFSLDNQQYYYDDGVYYEPQQGGYQAVPAPVGALVSFLPPGYETVPLGDDNFYYYGGTFYVAADQGYQVVLAPYGAIVSEIPDGAVSQDINGQTYLVYNNTYYQPVSADGQDAYQVVQVQ